MGVPFSQMWTVAQYVRRQKRRGIKRYPLVLMLEPLFRCNLACAGCGKVQYPRHIRMDEMSAADCLSAVDECGAPIVSFTGGEPLLHTQIDEIVRKLVEKRRYVYLCTNALLLIENLDRFKPSKHLTFSIHLDGPKEHHDFSVCREGVYEAATKAIREALARGFRVTTNTTLFENADPITTRAFFDHMMDLGVESMTISPGYAYEKAANQDGFLKKQQVHHLFRSLLSNRHHHKSKRRWVFNQSPLFLEFLMGLREYDCTPWGTPTRNIFGWQVPCYLMQDGYVDTFTELLEQTDWSRYGRSSGNPKCANCMVHSGYEPSAVNDTFSGPGGMWATIRAIFLNRSYRDDSIN